MASNIRVHQFAEDIRRNVDKVSTGIRVSASDTKREGYIGKIVIGCGNYRIKAFIDDGDNFSIRAVGRRSPMKATRCRELIFALSSMGYTVERDGNYIVSNIVFTRSSIADLAVALVA